MAKLQRTDSLHDMYDVEKLTSHSTDVTSITHVPKSFFQQQKEKEKEKEQRTAGKDKEKFITLNEQISYLRSGEYAMVNTPTHVLSSIWSWFNNRAQIGSQKVFPELSVSEKDELVELFASMDEDNSGEISIKEMTDAFKFLGMSYRSSYMRVKRLMNEHDADRSGTLDMQEFTQLMRKSKLATLSKNEGAGDVEESKTHGPDVEIPLDLVIMAYKRKKMLEALTTNDVATCQKMRDKWAEKNYQNSMVVASRWKNRSFKKKTTAQIAAKRDAMRTQMEEDERRHKAMLARFHKTVFESKRSKLKAFFTLDSSVDTYEMMKRSVRDSLSQPDTMREVLDNIQYRMNAADRTELRERQAAEAAALCRQMRTQPPEGPAVVPCMSPSPSCNHKDGKTVYSPPKQWTPRALTHQESP
eukprot:CAMPEP_0118953400 /NCGR_PEP_ID=MMETSP1169-20130426/56492_1 /TAXON_ID=36882 /ORGANISM="Pyramimonas obovata, Strain CCMP722" /LENGTH=413 /DNA_ID=CAMNT_0006900845 /DNA_START=125 /DNA_END=1363 /DNA_ORIENTATION=+